MSSGRRVLSAVNLAMAALFALAAAIQFNDPDPTLWVAVYAAAAIGCLLFRRVPRVWIGQAALAAAALLWGAAVLLDLGGPVDPDALLDVRMKMRGDATEKAREAGGLLLVAAWMAVLAIAGWRGRRR